MENNLNNTQDFLRQSIQLENSGIYRSNNQTIGPKKNNKKFILIISLILFFIFFIVGIIFFWSFNKKQKVVNTNNGKPVEEEVKCNINSIDENSFINKLNNYGFISTIETEQVMFGSGDAVKDQQYTLNTLTKKSSNDKQFDIKARVYTDLGENNIKGIIDNYLNKYDPSKKEYITQKFINNDIQIYILYYQNKYIQNDTTISREYKGLLRYKDVFIDFSSTVTSAQTDLGRGLVYYDVEKTLSDIIKNLGCNIDNLSGNYTNPNDLSEEKKIIARKYSFISKTEGKSEDIDVNSRIDKDKQIYSENLSDYESPYTWYVYYSGDSKVVGEHLESQKLVKDSGDNWESLTYAEVYEFTDNNMAKDYYSKVIYDNSDNYKIDTQTSNSIGFYQITSQNQPYLSPNYFCQSFSDKTVTTATIYTYKDIADEKTRIAKSLDLKEKCFSLLNTLHHD